MFFVPPVQSQGSPTALELGQKLVAVIQEFKQSHPGVSAGEIEQALQLAALHSGGTRRRKVLLIVALGLLCAGLVAAFMASGTHPRQGFPVMSVIVGLLVVVGLVAVMAAKR